VLKTATSTEVSKNTLTQTETSTTQTTSVVPQTTTVTESETEYVFINLKSFINWRLTCTEQPLLLLRYPTNEKLALPILLLFASVEPITKLGIRYPATAVRFELCEIGRNADYFVACYLTTTKQCNQPTRTWSTVTKPTATAYVTLFKFTTLTKYNTKTVDVLQTATKIATTVLTDVSTTTVGITETIPATSVVATATASNAPPLIFLATLLTSSSHYRYDDCSSDCPS
jgi:hypothetical protein